MCTMQTRRNRRGVTEHFVKGQHLKLNELKETARRFGFQSQYLYKENIPKSPEPEFIVSGLKHETNREGLMGIWMDEGFKGSSEDSLVWWSLAVGPEDLMSAEKRLLETTFPNRTEEQAAGQQSFLDKFTTSPAFLETSRLGTYRFTFPLEEVLTAYSQQFCSGAPPTMRLYETVLYKQEVMHVVLVHRPDDLNFSDYPELKDEPNAVCVYRDGCFIWRPEAMSETHQYELICHRDRQQMEARNVVNWPQFYVWNHVAVALHAENSEPLKFEVEQLRKNLKFCEQEEKNYKKNIPDNFDDAKKLVRGLWPDQNSPLEKELSLSQSLKVPDIKLVLVGRTAVGKSSCGNVILGGNMFGTNDAAAITPSGPTPCGLQSQKVFSWNVTIVDCPGFSEPSDLEALRHRIFKSINMWPRAPHVFLLVIRLETFAAEIRGIEKQMEELFGVNVWKCTMILLTQVDQTDPDIQKQLQQAAYQMKFLLRKGCSRNQVFDIKPDPGDDRQQVYDLMYEVMKMKI